MFFKDKEAKRDNSNIVVGDQIIPMGKLAEHILTDKPIDETEYAKIVCSVVWPIMEEVVYWDSKTKDQDVMNIIDERCLSITEIGYIFDWIDEKVSEELSTFIKENETLKKIQKKKDQSKDISEMVSSSIDHAIRWAVTRALWYSSEPIVAIAKWNMRPNNLKKLFKMK